MFGNRSRMNECGLMAHVEIDTVVATALHLVVDCPRNDVTRSEVLHLVVTLHEGLAALEAKNTALAAQRLTDEKALGFGVEQAGGMELEELHVRQLCASTIGHRHPVTGRDVGVRSIEIDLPCAAGRQYGRSCKVGLHLAAGFVEDVSAYDALWPPELRRLDEVDRHVVFGDVDVGRRHRRLYEHPLDFLACDVPCVNDTSSAVTTFASEIERKAFFGTTELCAEVHQLANSIGAIAYHHLDDVSVRKPSARPERVIDVRFEGIRWIEHCGDPALRPVRRRVRAAPLRDDGHAAVASRLEREAQASHPSSEHKIVALRSHEPRSLTA